MDGVGDQEQKRLEQVQEFAVRLYGLHAAANLLDISNVLTEQAVERAEFVDTELRKVLANLGAAVTEMPGTMGEPVVWVVYRGKLVPRTGELVYRDRWHNHLMNPHQPMFPDG